MLAEESAAFGEESDALYRLLHPLDDGDWAVPTQFNGWTINDVMAHLHSGNISALVSLTDRDAYLKARQERSQVAQQTGASNLALQHHSIGNITGRELLARWHEQYRALAAAFAQADPKKRVPWAGRDMSARSSISARLMETWAHGQEIYDQLGVVRTDTDRIHHIAMLGVNTFGWSFSNRGLPVPAERPTVQLVSPSGRDWAWPGTAPASECITGAASEFCQVVAQTRNIADTRLVVSGEIAASWMANAQCFAGPPRVPPAPGTRYTQPRKGVQTGGAGAG
jgi:uncharacterized protein (TIGR03084 family)